MLPAPVMAFVFVELMISMLPAFKEALAPTEMAEAVPLTTSQYSAPDDPLPLKVNGVVFTALVLNLL